MNDIGEPLWKVFMKEETRGRNPIGNAPADGLIRIRVERRRKGIYVRAARQSRTAEHPRGQTLSQWVLDACDAALSGGGADPSR